LAAIDDEGGKQKEWRVFLKGAGCFPEFPRTWVSLCNFCRNFPGFTSV